MSALDDPGALTTEVADAPPRAGQADVARFDATERVVHWSTAVLMLSLLVTGSILYVPTFALDVGHRSAVEQIHVITGLALLAPLLLGVAGPWRRRLLDDLRRLDRWTRADWAWFRRRRQDRALAAALGRGKFNGGQKAEAALLGGGMVLMVMTGVVMRWSPPFPNRWATGATFFHDLGFLALLLAVVGHAVVGLSKPDQFTSMFTGRVPRSWAEKYAPGWLREVELESPDGGGAVAGDRGGALTGASGGARSRRRRSARPGPAVESGR